VRIHLRMGINTGQWSSARSATSCTTNLAARLQWIAEPGSIRVSLSTQRAPLPYFEFKGTRKACAERHG
jgi:class 3 adenylate cyclase